ncbi:MAG: hypothetical protein KCHDKBKB_01281 [Elusimicrobia bacterium]|nr:hypothetical protein [Elusimicrobiota bacterium]
MIFPPLGLALESLTPRNATSVWLEPVYEKYQVVPLAPLERTDMSRHSTMFVT